VRPRRRLARLLAGCLAAPVLGVLLAGCGGAAHVPNLPTVTGAMGEQASISIPGSLEPPTKVESSVLEQGGGAQLADGEAVVVDYTLMNWTGAKLIGSTYSTGGAPNKTQEFVLGSSSALPSWNQVLPKVKIGSRSARAARPPTGSPAGTISSTCSTSSGRIPGTRTSPARSRCSRTPRCPRWPGIRAPAS
jgi:peptidylprolyl isomerase